MNRRKEMKILGQNMIDLKNESIFFHTHQFNTMIIL